MLKVKAKDWLKMSRADRYMEIYRAFVKCQQLKEI